MGKKDNKKEDEEILFPEVKVKDYVIKPWSFGILFDISEMLEGILDKLDEKNIKLDSMFSDEGFISYTNILRLFTIASKDVLEIIAITLDVDKEELKGLDMADGIKIATIIYKQNSEMFVKNFMAPQKSGGKK